MNPNSLLPPENDKQLITRHDQYWTFGKLSSNSHEMTIFLSQPYLQIQTYDTVSTKREYVLSILGHNEQTVECSFELMLRQRKLVSSTKHLLNTMFQITCVCFHRSYDCPFDNSMAQLFIILVVYTLD